MSKRVYRDLYFKKDILNFRGSTILYYTGKIVRNAGNLEKFKGAFDRHQDYYQGCDCDANIYSAVLKV